MANTCKICQRRDIEKIDKLIVSDDSSLRKIAVNLKVSYSSLYRHAKTCIPEKLLKLKEVRKELEAGNINEQLNRTYMRAQKMSDACDKYLADPDEDGEYYLGPRGLDVDIVYERKVGDSTVTLKKNLQALVNELDLERAEEVFYYSSVSRDKYYFSTHPSMRLYVLDGEYYVLWIPYFSINICHGKRRGHPHFLEKITEAQANTMYSTVKPQIEKHGFGHIYKEFIAA